MKLSKNYIYALVGLAALVVLILIMARGALFTKKPVADGDSIKVEQGGDSATIYATGKVFLKSKTLADEAIWGSNKTKSFFKFITDKFESGEFVEGVQILEGGSFLVTYTKDGVTYTIILTDDDEEEILTYFEDPSATSTPSVTQSPTGSGGGAGGTGGTGGTGGGTSTPVPGPDPDCPFWRLSYCVYPRTPTPTQTPSGTTNPFPNLVYDCDLGDSTVTQRTVISNTLCVKSPTPTPQQ